MKKFCSAVLTSTLLGASAAPALAGSVVFTPPLPSNINNATGTLCAVVNIGTRTAEVTIDIINANNGDILPSTGQGSGTIDPMLEHVVWNQDASHNTYCRVTGLSSKTGRVLYFAIDASGNVLMSVTAP